MINIVAQFNATASFASPYTWSQLRQFILLRQLPYEFRSYKASDFVNEMVNRLTSTIFAFGAKKDMSISPQLLNMQFGIQSLYTHLGPSILSGFFFFGFWIIMIILTLIFAKLMAQSRIKLYKDVNVQKISLNKIISRLWDNSYGFIVLRFELDKRVVEPQISNFKVKVKANNIIALQSAGLHSTEMLNFSTLVKKGVRSAKTTLTHSLSKGNLALSQSLSRGNLSSLVHSLSRGNLAISFTSLFPNQPERESSISRKPSIISTECIPEEVEPVTKFKIETISEEQGSPNELDAIGLVSRQKIDHHRIRITPISSVAESEKGILSSSSVESRTPYIVVSQPIEEIDEYESPGDERPADKI